MPASATLIAAAAFFAACSSSPASPGGSTGGDGGCQAYEPPAGFNASSPTVSFSADVMPIFTTSCAFPSCHGSTAGAAAGMYLGTEAATTYANIVNIQASQYPAMVRVKPGDPTNSFLLHRIDDDACSLSGCTTVECSELMPQGGPALAQANLLTIRGWIAQGALNDSTPSDGGGGSTDAGGSGGGADASGD